MTLDFAIFCLALFGLLMWWEPAIFVLLVPFIILRVVATVLLLVAMVGQMRDYWLPAIDAEDRALAASFFKNGGRYTISAECGSVRQRTCLLCLALRSLFRLLAKVPGLEKLSTHFDDEAKKAGLPL